ncbi:protein S100-A8-like [Vombatus ursinus]|uniref:EF-hand domain-containing protein n=1 Tax=Vombatus ursinus TaxID=29139 RepID=A0A4X2JM96_VOMUR|nr:protein S100-A8 [Vombatus ursinus]XP_027727283.1 protein S100-A8-like [Vombatus ursinus]
MVTKFEGAINCMVDVFHKYSLEHGHPHAMNRKAFRKLIETECPELLTNPKDPKTVETLLKEVDSNKDDLMNFEEYLFMITRLMVDAHEASHK